ncbi:MAG TPA: DUF559 domain-containing protein [Candidatus Aminicenantes bacterium]|nr:DUF559 domain-containing protein [Candidatus Aminicenantes bacterium]
MISTKRINGTLNVWLGKRGGNGQFTPQQVLLATALGWPMEVAISLGKRQKGYPTNYKVDVGNKKLKLGIEVDGKNHRMKRNILKDKKKENKLEELGWKVLRFTNKEITMNLSRVLFKIKKEIKAM